MGQEFKVGIWRVLLDFYLDPVDGLESLEDDMDNSEFRPYAEQFLKTYGVCYDL